MIFLLNSDKVIADIYIEHNNLPSNIIQHLTKLLQDLKKELDERYIK